MRQVFSQMGHRPDHSATVSANFCWLMARAPRLTCLCAVALIVWCSACSPRPIPPAASTQVRNGQLYVSGQTEFDALFRELNELQVMLFGAEDEERAIRKLLAKSLGVEDGATRQVLSERVAALAGELNAKKIRIKLEVEGLDADDAADTMAQAKIVGNLDSDAQAFVESTTSAARQALRFAARLRYAQRQVERMAQHANALEPWVDGTFATRGPTKVSEVKRNLDDARRQFPLLSLRASNLAEEARRTVQRLAAALTTDASLGSNKEPPLIAPADPSAASRRPQRYPAAAGVTKKSAPPVAPKGADSAGA
ncbi:MAG TPA: hypothetical protein VIV60_24170, partial [Polyangiaceae bacterium]